MYKNRQQYRTISINAVLLDHQKQFYNFFSLF